MIIVYHKENKVVEVEFEKKTICVSQMNIAKTLFEMAALHPQSLIVWCHIDFRSSLNVSKFQDIFHHSKIMASYSPFFKTFLPDSIGYVEESPFIKINRKVNYPTWQTSSWVGGLNAAVLVALNGKIKATFNFDYFLHSLAKLAMETGLFCYSDPTLLIDNSTELKEKRNNSYILFRFVKQHYRTRWVFLLFMNLLLYKRKFAIFPLIHCFIYRRRKLADDSLEQIQVQSTKNIFSTKTIDVIIPTIGRKQYLYDVLKDLSVQSHLPKNVIIVEQNTNVESSSELDYLKEENWPFGIKHIFTHQPGACNARNVALKEVSNDWVFMADDDIRIKESFLKEAFVQINKFGLDEITFACNEAMYDNSKENYSNIQWETFGSGCSIVKRQSIENIRYRKGFEFGYGEDTDFGMQLRNKGVDIIYFTQPEILHLKAPIGGFRTKPVLEWQNDSIQPKPSPTVMLYKQLHLTEEQINGYKMILFFKFYKVQNTKNPVRYYKNFQKQWKQSLYWANQLITK
ncbi:glycosyltransferase family 2 protein [Flavobacterium sp. N502540]|uniref:glycosyltransferase family 2 protein n=1 Tax=Flavobacterium sp. N502540 TaxID=2986838 RepID=UPI002224EFBC|nr:glycosyltransferase family A protein [Flavobacterium sp. N502540]